MEAHGFALIIVDSTRLPRSYSLLMERNADRFLQKLRKENYCVAKKKLLAILKFMKIFYKYFYSKKNVLPRIDHVTLKWLLQHKDPE